MRKLVKRKIRAQFLSLVHCTAFSSPSCSICNTELIEVLWWLCVKEIEHLYIKNAHCQSLPQKLSATMSSFAPSSLFAVLCASCFAASGCKQGSVPTLWHVTQDIILTSLAHKSSYFSVLSSSISCLILTPRTHVVTISTVPAATVYLINPFLFDPYRNLFHLHLTNLVHSPFIYSHLVTYTRFVYPKS